jgi:integrase/recombinase XerD
MSEAQMQRILALETNQRNHAMLRLMYNTGIRVSEVCAITWNDLQERKEGAQIRVFGKGEKECYILLSEETYAELI